MKKISKILLLFGLVIALSVPLNVSARTLKDLRKDLADLKQEKKDNAANQAKIERDLEQTKEEMREITNKIVKATKDEEATQKEIIKLEEEIKVKQEQIKELMVFFQISNNENFYLKYIFGADSFTDFIYRFSLIEQLTARSDELVKEMNALIAQNELKLKELEAKKIELRRLNEEAIVKVEKLGNKKSVFMDEVIDIDAQIKGVQGKIDFYVKAGCSETANLNSCTTTVPFDFGFEYPIF